MNALEFMARFERDFLSFYEALGTTTSNYEKKELYMLLSDTQKKHLSTLEVLKETVRDSDAESLVFDRAIKVINGLRQVLFTDDLTKGLKNDRDAYWHVVSAEEEMIRLFEGMAKVESGANTKALFSWLAEDEKRHLEKIEEIYQFVEAPDCYLEWGEFPNLHPL